MNDAHGNDPSHQLSQTSQKLLIGAAKRALFDFKAERGAPQAMMGGFETIGAIPIGSDGDEHVGERNIIVGKRFEALIELE